LIIIDINVLVYAHRADEPKNAGYAEWLVSAIRSPETFAIPSVVGTGFVRIVTHPRIYDPPTPLARALQFIDSLRDRPNHAVIEAGPRHWTIFRRLCTVAGLKGADISDAHLAAIAIESGAGIISTDSGFGRFPDLRWRRPFPERRITG
jgi:hypothetical protein